jgi:hypothetical protein
VTASARASALALSALVVLAAAGCGSDPAPPHVPPSPVAPDLRDRVGFAPLEAATDATLVTLPGEVVLPTGASRPAGRRPPARLDGRPGRRGRRR